LKYLIGIDAIAVDYRHRRHSVTASEQGCGDHGQRPIVSLADYRHMAFANPNDAKSNVYLIALKLQTAPHHQGVDAVFDY
jgi:hypothetical protein